MSGLRHPTGARWTMELRAAVGARLAAGADNMAIAAALGVSRPSVARERARLGLAPIGSRWGERPHVARGPSAIRRALEPDFADLHAKGLSDPAIARTLGCRPCLVFKWRTAARLPARSLGGRPRGPQKRPAPRIAPPRAFKPISPVRDPLYAAALCIARTASPFFFEDVASDLVEAVLTGELDHPTHRAAAAFSRRYLGMGRNSLDAVIGFGGLRLSEVIADNGALEAFAAADRRIERWRALEALA